MPAAEKYFRESLKGMEGHVGTWHGLALSVVQQGRLDEAKAIYEQTLEMDRNFAESHGGLALVLALQQQPELAREALDRAMRLDRESLLGAYAATLLNGGDLAAQELFQRVVQTNLNWTSERQS